ncbi:unnamed protein product (macronuclear) [Paramecium tetraurelia]|uniref:B box-type domain-containing protein n=1 Tax=Paramecium tetraurelia TaxID=5888 RepID=A0DLU2_PARTE|nr:uncharacterized protein GSPATT00039641001 [Paramecium tetraurelia]CAK84009.1 unnamed protein product [Paramecium tetraurelia]|eukprot:XP_001451406.1 hypothetical protein (macronuclear) [Paramecium tetraurelia strain d4-2]
MNFIEQFQKIKCTKHPQAPISNICLNQECKEEQYFCQNCIKLHLTHSTHIIYMKQIDKLLKRHTNVNEIIQDKQGLEAFNVFRSFKTAIEDRLNQLEDELRLLILKLVNDQKMNDQGYKFLQSLNQFNEQDIKELRLFLINQQQNIQNNQINLKEKESKQQLVQLTSYLQDKIPNIQKSMIDQLDCVNSTFYTKTERVERLRKVWIADDGQSKPSIFDKSTIRANVFQVREKQLYLIGIFQPILYKGSYNSTNYDSQVKTPKLIYKLHEDTNLTKYIFKQHKVLEHDKLQVVDGHLYFIEFRNPIKLLPNKTYTISISTKEAKLFQTYHYSIPVIDHPLIKWQTEDLTDSDIFTKGPYVQHIYSYANIDQIPSLVVKT